MKRDQSLDVLRGIAVLMVTGHHYHYYALWTQAGGAGVDLFFVLSGYLISGLLFIDLKKTGRINVKRFLIRRGLKIYPAYYAMVLCLLPFTVHTVTWADFTFMGAYFHVLWGHGWSLSVEEHFYLVLPVLFFFSVRWFRSRTLAWVPFAAPILLVLCAILRYRYSMTHDVAWGITPTHLRIDSLFAGVVLGWFRHIHKSQLRLAHAWVYGLVGMIAAAPGLFVGPLNLQSYASFGYLSLTVGFSLILIYAVNSQAMKARWLRPVAWLGIYSYSVYLWHIAIAKLFTVLVKPTFLSFWLYMAVCFLVGILAARLVEIPVLRIRDRWFPASCDKRRVTERVSADGAWARIAETVNASTRLVTQRTTGEP